MPMLAANKNRYRKYDCKGLCLSSFIIILIYSLSIFLIGNICLANPHAPSHHKPAAAKQQAPPDQFLIAGWGDAWLLNKDPHSGGWNVKLLPDMPKPVTDDADFSVPVVAFRNDVLICENSLQHSGEDANFVYYRFYSVDASNLQLSSLGVYQEPTSEIARLNQGGTLQAWLPAERKVLFAFHVGESLAGHGYLRLLDKEHVKSSYISKDESTEVARLSKAMDRDYDVINYSPDGSLLVMGAHKRVGVLNRRTQQIKIIKTWVSSFWALSVTADNSTVTWMGELSPKWTLQPGEEQEIDYVPEVDYLGIICLPTGTTRTWAMNKVNGVDLTTTQQPNQFAARIAYSPTSGALYFAWGGDLIHFDPSRNRAAVVAGGNRDFTLLADKNVN
jgi:hypothetical protein